MVYIKHVVLLGCTLFIDLLYMLQIGILRFIRFSFLEVLLSQRLWNILYIEWISCNTTLHYFKFLLNLQILRWKAFPGSVENYPKFVWLEFRIILWNVKTFTISMLLRNVKNYVTIWHILLSYIFKLYANMPGNLHLQAQCHCSCNLLSDIPNVVHAAMVDNIRLTSHRRLSLPHVSDSPSGSLYDPPKDGKVAPLY